MYIVMFYTQFPKYPDWVFLNDRVGVYMVTRLQVLVGEDNNWLGLGVGTYPMRCLGA